MTMKKSVGEQFIDHITASFFDSARIDRSKWEKQSKQPIRNDFDQYILPFKLHPDEKTIKTNISNVVCSNIANIQITQFSKEYLEKQIQLEVPKYIREFNLPEENSKLKPKAKRLTGNKRSFGDTDLKSNEPKKPKVEAQTNFHQLAIETVTKHSNMLPANFYEVADSLFEEFWNLQFEDKEVNFAFFANITIHNCRDYGLTAFSEKSYSFTVIREKLSHRQYLSIDDFLLDFTQLFANIMKYYPNTHNASYKARELKELFDLRWKEAVPKFRWR